MPVSRGAGRRWVTIARPAFAVRMAARAATSASAGQAGLPVGSRVAGTGLGQDHQPKRRVAGSASGTYRPDEGMSASAELTEPQ